MFKSFIKEYVNKHAKGYNWQNNVKCGIHSGFPLCCIVWHTLIHSHLYKTKKGVLIRDIYNAMTGVIAEHKNIRYYWIEEGQEKWFYGFGRIPCPIHMCFGKDTTVIRCECGKD